MISHYQVYTLQRKPKFISKQEALFQPLDNPAQLHPMNTQNAYGRTLMFSLHNRSDNCVLLHIIRSTCTHADNASVHIHLYIRIALNVANH